MKMIIEIDLDNAAFEDCSGSEVARILTKIANNIAGNILQDGDKDSLMDSNGNRVGFAEVKDDSENEDDFIDDSSRSYACQHGENADSCEICNQ